MEQSVIAVGPPQRAAQNATNRIGGIDLARAIAIAGMIAAHVGPVAGKGFAGWLYALPHGRASLLFVMLAGVGVSILGRSSLSPFVVRLRLAWFAMVLLPVGLALQTLDHGVWVVLHAYAALFLVGIIALRWRRGGLLAAALTVAVLGPALVLGARMLDPGLPILQGVAITDPIGDILLGLTLTGPYPIATWAAPFLFGMWVGRLDLRSQLVRERLVIFGAFAALLAPALAAGLAGLFGEPGGPRDLPYFFVAAAHSQMPLWLVASTGSAAMIVGLSLIVADRWPRASWPLRALGQLALTAYVIHVLALHFWHDTLVSSDVGRAAATLLGLVAALTLAATLWRAILPRGPLELVLHAPVRLAQSLTRPA